MMEVALVYFIGLFLTFGYRWNTHHGQKPDILCGPFEWGCEAALKGLIWPLYWLGRGAIFITQPTKGKGA